MGSATRRPKRRRRSEPHGPVDPPGPSGAESSSSVPSPGSAAEGPALVWDYGLLEQVFRHQVIDTVKTIAKWTRRNVATTVGKLMADIVRDPTRPEGYVYFFLFPRAVLRNLPPETLRKLPRRKRYDAQAKSITDRLTAWKANGHSRDSLIREVLDSPDIIERSSDTAKANLRRCEKLVREDGQLAKAVRALHSGGVAPSSPETTECLREKHPPGDPVQMQPLPQMQLEVEEDKVFHLIRSFPKGVGCGRSGWRAQHFFELASCVGTPFLGELTKLVNLLLSGRALDTFAPYMSSASLVPLLKKDSVSLRPVAVGEVLRRLVSKCCVQAVVMDAAEHLMPLQLGVGIQHGAEAILHALNRSLEGDLPEDTVMALLDFKNAFNMVERKKFMSEVLSRFPHIFAWVQYSYGSSATLFTGTDIIYAHRGVQQGDPLGPLLYALAIHPLLLRLRDKCDLAAAYLDDVTLQGSPQQVLDAIQIVEEDGPGYGVYLNAAKTVVWWPKSDGSVPDTYGAFGNFRRTLDPGVELLGGSLTLNRQYALDIAMKRADKCIESVRTMMALQDPQVCLMLLRSCEMMPKLVYCWRTTHPSFLGPVAKKLDEEVESTLRDIVVAGGPHFGAFQLALASLPVRLGGLGVFLPSDVASYAYAASLLSSMPLQNAILGVDPGLIPQFVRNLVKTFAETVYPSDPDQALELYEETLQPQTKHQETMALDFFAAKRRVLLDHDYIQRQSAKVRRRFRYVLDSAVEAPLASSWLFALPNAGMNQRMAPREYQVSLAFRLLMPQFPQGHRCQGKGCTQDMDEHGYHALFCTGKTFFDRHQTVRDALYDLAVLAGFHPVKDAYVECLGWNGARLRPADLKISGDGDFAFDCVDVTVVCPFSSTERSTGDLVVGKKAKNAEEQKYHKHEEACHNAAYGFKAFSMEVFGALGTRSMELLNRIRKAMVRTGHAGKKATAICYRKTSIALQRGIVRQVLAHLPEPDFL